MLPALNSEAMEERRAGCAKSTSTEAGTAVIMAPTREAGGWRRFPPGLMKGRVTVVEGEGNLAVRRELCFLSMVRFEEREEAYASLRIDAKSRLVVCRALRALTASKFLMSSKSRAARSLKLKLFKSKA